MKPKHIAALILIFPYLLLFPGCATRAVAPSEQAIHNTTSALEIHLDTADYKGGRAMQYFQ